MLENRMIVLMVTWVAGCSAAQAQSAGQPPELKWTLAVSSHHDRSCDRPSLLVHFHGAPKVTERNFHRAGLDGVLVTVNCPGLSSAYRRPFENANLFPSLMSDVRRELVNDGLFPESAKWGRVDLSCFSAGYGAVRELLKHAEARRQIHAVLAADSIYASIHTDGSHRLVDEAQMQPFLNFARMAMRGDKTFLISHSQLPVEPYASTVETADYLLRLTQLQRRSVEPAMSSEFEPISIASHGNFSVLSYAGDDGDAHLRHLKEISTLWRRLRCSD